MSPLLSRLALLAGAAGFFLVSCARPAAPSVPEAKPVAAPAKKQPAESAEKPRPKLKASEKGKVTSISLTDAFTHQQSGNALIIDARPGFLHTLSHIPGAISVPRSVADREIAANEAKLKAAAAAKTPIIVYCTGFLCPDARTVANHLADAGYSSSVLEGGWDAWKEGGLPTE
jgi:rhodanese-related sulfurtransferase